MGQMCSTTARHLRQCAVTWPGSFIIPTKEWILLSQSFLGGLDKCLCAKYMTMIFTQIENRPTSETDYVDMGKLKFFQHDTEERRPYVFIVMNFGMDLSLGSKSAPEK